MNTTNIADSDVSGDFSFLDWRFEGNMCFLFLAILELMVNLFAFVFIYRDRKSFDNKGFWEQLLLLCGSDALNGIVLFVFSLFQIDTMRRSIQLVNVAGALFAFSQILSYGSILGISIQRLISVKKANNLTKPWNKSHKILYCLGNFITAILLVLIFFVIKRIAPSQLSASTLIFVVELSICIIMIDIVCFLTLFYLHKNLKQIQASVLNDEHNTGSRSMKNRVHYSKSHGGSQNIASTSIDDGRRIGHKGNAHMDTVRNGRVTDPEMQFGEKVQCSLRKHRACTDGSGSGVDHLASEHNDIGTDPNEKETIAQTDQSADADHMCEGVCDDMPTRLEPSVREAAISSSTNHGLRAKHSKITRYKREAGLTVINMVLFLNILTFVTVACSVASRFDRNPRNLPKYRAAVMLITLNSLVNPFVYVFKLKSLRASLYKALRVVFGRYRQ